MKTLVVALLALCACRKTPPPPRPLEAAVAHDAAISRDAAVDPEAAQLARERARSAALDRAVDAWVEARNSEHGPHGASLRADGTSDPADEGLTHVWIDQTETWLNGMSARMREVRELGNLLLVSDTRMHFVDRSGRLLVDEVDRTNVKTVTYTGEDAAQLTAIHPEVDVANPVVNGMPVLAVQSVGGDHATAVLIDLLDYNEVAWLELDPADAGSAWRLVGLARDEESTYGAAIVGWARVGDAQAFELGLTPPGQEFQDRELFALRNGKLKGVAHYTVKDPLCMNSCDDHRVPRFSVSPGPAPSWQVKLVTVPMKIACHGVCGD